MENIKSQRRGFRVQKQTGYKVNNISLVNRYCINKIKDQNGNNINNVFKININGVFIDHTSEDEDFVYFDFKEIRDKFRDLIPMTKEEHQFEALETTLVYNSLCAQNAYKNLPKEIFNNTIFTNKDLDIRIFPVTTKPAQLDLDEEYYTSDIHKETYGDS